MYCPKINYCFNDNDILLLNKRIKAIALNYHEEHTGWFDVGKNDQLVFIDEQENMFLIYLRGRFFRRDEPDFDLEFVRLEKDKISFDFEIKMFDDHI
jgi:hypothetical protein